MYLEWLKWMDGSGTLLWGDLVNRGCRVLVISWIAWLSKIHIHVCIKKNIQEMETHANSSTFKWCFILGFILSSSLQQDSLQSQTLVRSYNKNKSKEGHGCFLKFDGFEMFAYFYQVGIQHTQMLKKNLKI